MQNWPYVSIKKYFIIFIFIQILLLQLYIYNPYFLLRPLQISEISEISENEKMFSAEEQFSESYCIPEYLIPIFDIPNKGGDNFSFTRSTRIKMFLNGEGNCSQKASGLGCILDSIGKKYSIIHFLPCEGMWDGNGHSVIRLKDSVSFLFDPIHKFIPIINLKDKRFTLLDISQLRRGVDNLKSLNHLEFNYLPSSISKYYSNSFTSAYAEVSQKSMNDYFDQNLLIQNLFNLKENKLSRLIINGIAAISFKLPTFYVTHVEYKRIKEHYPEFISLKILAFFFIFNTYLIFFLSFFFIKFHFKF
jgi:hypothetical protein